MNFFHTNKKGFTILFAVLVSSVLLAVGASIFNITTKNLLFASSGRESLKAFAAADTGLECAEYWDRYGDGIFLTATNPVGLSSYRDVAQCAGKKLVGEGGLSVSINGGTAVNTFKMNTGVEAGDMCATVTVIKSPKTGDPSKIHTVIESRGYNTCDETNQRRLERGVKISYDEI